MPNKVLIYKELGEQATADMIGDELRWKSFLETSARLYKYPYHEQLLIYAQYPDATACASFDFWNKEMGRYICRGSKGIALLDPSRDYTRLKYVFDVSQTGSRESSRDPYIWQYRSEYENAVTSALERRFGVMGEKGIIDQMEQLSEHLVGEYWSEHRYDLHDILAESILGEYDEDIREKVFEKVAAVSTFYTLLVRCGMQSLRSFDSEDFIGFSDFNSPKSIMALGTVVSESGEDVLRQIEDAIRKYEREKITERTEKNERINLHEERRLSDPQPGIDGARIPSHGQIRHDEEELSEELSSDTVERLDSVRTAIPSSSGDRGNSESANGANDGGSDEVSRSDGGTESSRPDEMDRMDEHPQSSSGRNDPGRIDLSVNIEEPFLQSGQLSLFPSEEDQIQYIAEAESAINAPSAFSQADIDAELIRGSGMQGGKMRIYAFFHHPMDSKSAVDFLKEEYGWYGHSHTFLDGSRGHVNYSPKGMLLEHYDPEYNQTLPWNEVEKRLRRIISEGRYLTEQEKEQYRELQYQYASVGGVPIPNPRSRFPDTPIVVDDIEETYSEDALDANPISVQVEGEWQTFPNVAAAEEAIYEDSKAESRRNAQNFRIVDDNLGVGGPKAKYQANINAIKLMKELEADGRQALPAQQEVLSRYVGWGGLADAFDSSKENWRNEYAELKELLTSDEYESARASTLNAHYTSPTVIRAIYEAVGNMGFKTGNILEPSMGIGNFFGMLPGEMQASALYGVELDSITGRIAKQLYPKANITVAGFETTDRRDFFDLAIGNVPFGNYQVNDRAYNKLGFSIHDYFLAKSLDQVRPGGLIAFVTSRYTMDKQSSEVRKYIAQRAELLGAIRLPNNAFKANAGTEVVSDILFLQKREHPIDMEPEWVHLGLNEDGFAINSYFIFHPEMILGRQTSESTQYGKQDFTVAPIEGLMLSDQLHDAVKYIHGTYKEMEFASVDEMDTSLPADPNVKNYSYALINDNVYFRENSRMVRPNLNVTAAERIKGMVGLRNCVNELIDLQMDEYSTETEIEEKQNELNYLYDAFSKKYGLINDRSNRLAFSADSSYYLLCSLEILDDEGRLKRKADMFTKRTIKQRSHVESVDTASEALTVSISEKACVDLEYMAVLLGGEDKISQIIDDLRGVIFKDPQTGAFDWEFGGENWNRGWQTADEYLSGNVRRKLRIAQSAAEKDPFFSRNVEALNAAQPKDLDASEIEVRLGATWLDKDYVQQFMYETFETPRYLRDNITVKFVPYTSEWQVTQKNRVSLSDVTAYTTYGTDRANAYRILEDSLNLRDIRIYDTVVDADGKERRVLNSKETTLAAQKQQLIRDAFKDWIWQDPERREKLVRQYNDEMNCIRPREYDGSHITFPGMNPEITLREHQVNAVAHVLYGGNTLLAHEVGAGKTFEMIAAAMESKRLGLCHKSIFVVPNHLTEQWASEFLRLYPSANILVTTKKDFETHNRKKFCARIATGDYDAVIIGHSQFERIPISAERQERLLREQIEEISDGIQEVKNSNGENFTIKSLERTKKSLEARLKKLQDTERKDDVVTFEQLGVDRMFVDESDNYKNLYLYTKMRNVAGLTTTDALKSSDMFAKCRYLDELTGSRGVIFATGTPISNSITELYTIQRYLQHDRLQEMGMLHFDSWASRFGETTTALELAPEGTGYRTRTRFAKFFNLPELMNLFKEVADIKTSDQLDLPTPQVEYHTFASKPTETQKGMVLALSERATKVHGGSVDASVDNMLKITSDGRKLGLDQRILNPMLPDEEMTKVNQCVRNILHYWREGEEDKLTQLVFCDISTPKTSSHRATKTMPGNLDDVISLEEKEEAPFTVYEDIRKKLILGGMAAEQIAFIHDANTEVKKRELFAKVRNGQVRVLIGSTSKMGAGTNVQDRLIALHDLDCPWRPRDLIQRKGRIERQGNQNETVNVCRYVTEGTFDAYLWQTVETKQRFISQIMTSKSPVRSCEDVDATALSFAEIKALCAGDPRIKERMDLDVEVSKLKIMKADHQSKQYRLEDSLIRYYPNTIEEKKGLIHGFESDMRLLHSHPLPTDGFVGMEIRGDHLTDKENAGAALLDVCKEVKRDDPIPIGSYRGFSMAVSYDYWNQEYVLTLKGEISHKVKLGGDAKGNLIRIEHVLDKMPERLQVVRDQLDNLYNQQEAARSEAGKPFPQEKELTEKTARLIELDMELNLDGKGQAHSDEIVAKSDRPSVLDKLKTSLEKERPEKSSSQIKRGMVL